jgi:anti-sigma factor RsiW
MPAPREMGCSELADAVTTYLEGALSAVDRQRLEAHLRDCARCRPLVAQSRAVVESLRRLEDGPKASSPEKERLAALFREHGFHRPGRPRPRIPLGLGNQVATPGDHLAYFWESEREFLAAIGVITAGAAEGEACVLLGHEEANDRLEIAARRAGVDTAALRREGRLSFVSGGRTADGLLGKVGEQIELAVDRGAPLVRVIGNLGWGRPGWPDDLDLLRLEARTTDAVRRLPVVVMCAYDVRHVPGSRLLLGGLECHPLTYRRGVLRSNEFYVPAEQFLDTLRPSDQNEPSS